MRRGDRVSRRAPPPGRTRGHSGPEGAKSGRAKSPACSNGAARGAVARSIWLISFTDLMCLMLAFFVLAFSMSEPVQPRWQALAASLAARQIEGRSGAVFNVALLNPNAPINLDYLGILLKGQFTVNSDMAGLAPVREDDRLVIGLPDSLLFEADRANFTERGREALFVLGGVLGRISNRIEITGHVEAERLPAESERDPWELSLARAVAVGTALHQAGYQRHLVVRTVTGRIGPAATGREHLIDIVVRDLEEGS